MAEVIDVGGQTASTGSITAKINPEEARARAASLNTSADAMKSILDAVSEQMNRIGDSSNLDSVSYSSKTDQEIRLEFERLYGEFPRFYNSIIKSADDIRDIADRMEQE